MRSYRGSNALDECHKCRLYTHIFALVLHVYMVKYVVFNSLVFISGLNYDFQDLKEICAINSQYEDKSCKTRKFWHKLRIMLD